MEALNNLYQVGFCAQKHTSSSAQKKLQNNPATTPENTMKFLEARANAVKAGINIQGAPLIVDEDDSLFPFAAKKPELNIDKISPESLVMVHMTKYFPKGGKIKSTKAVSADENGVSMARSTIHFAMNKSVTEHAFGNKWGTMPYAVLIPFQEAREVNPETNLLGGITDDFACMDEVKLPKGTVILKYNENIPKGKLKVTDAVFDGKKADGIKVVETSNKNTGAVATKLVKKMGYSSMEDVMAKGSGLTKEEYKFMTTPPENRDMEYINKLCELSERSNLQECAIQLAKTWGKFSKENDYIALPALLTPWHRSESVIQCIDILNKADIGWETSENGEFAVDYKKELITVLNECEEMLPEGKKLSFDTDKMRKIIKESDSPKQALQTIADEMKLKPLPPRDEVLQDEETQNVMPDDEMFDDEMMDEKDRIYLTLDSLVAISKEQKMLLNSNLYDEL